MPRRSTVAMRFGAAMSFSVGAGILSGAGGTYGRPLTGAFVAAEAARRARPGITGFVSSISLTAELSDFSSALTAPTLT